MKISGIYKIESKIKPERIYIGSAVNIDHRWNIHLFDLRRNKHHSLKLQRHYNRHGESDFQFSILLGCEKKDLIDNEQFFIDSLIPYFNICKIAGSSLGIKRSEEYKRNSSESRKGKKQSEETIQKRVNKMIGHEVSLETREKLRISNTDKKRSEETKNKNKEITTKLWETPEYRDIVTKTHIGIKQSQDTINKRRFKNFKPVLQLDDNENVIKEWNSIVETNSNIFDSSHISECCNGKRQRTGGFKWKYKEIA